MPREKLLQDARGHLAPLEGHDGVAVAVALEHGQVGQPGGVGGRLGEVLVEWQPAGERDHAANRVLGGQAWKLGKS